MSSGSSTPPLPPERRASQRKALWLLIGVSVVAVGGLIFVLVILFQWQTATSRTAQSLDQQWSAVVQFFGQRMSELVAESDRRLIAVAEQCGALASREPPLSFSLFLAYMRGIDDDVGTAASTNFSITVAWAPAVLRRDVAQFEAAVRATNAPLLANFSVAARGDNELLFPLLYIGSAATSDPPPQSTISVLGVDLRSDDGRRPALDLAVRIRGPTATGVVPSLGTEVPTMVIYEPVFDFASGRLLGVGYSAFALTRFVNATLQDYASALRQVQWYDIDPETNVTTFLYKHNASEPLISDAELRDDPLADSYTFSFAQRRWRVDMAVRPGLIGGNRVPIVTWVVLPLAALVLVVAGALLMRYRVRIDREQRHRQLLGMVVPEHVMSHLVSHIEQIDGDTVLTQALVADFYSDVTLCFIDICDFTLISSRLTPKSLVRFLDELVSTIDNIVVKYRPVLKIKTIGDAYFVASGVHEPEQYLQRPSVLGLSGGLAAGGGGGGGGGSASSFGGNYYYSSSEGGGSGDRGGGGGGAERSGTHMSSGAAAAAAAALAGRFEEDNDETSASAQAAAAAAVAADATVLDASGSRRRRRTSSRRGSGGGSASGDRGQLGRNSWHDPNARDYVNNMVAALMFCCEVRETIQTRKFQVTMLPDRKRRSVRAPQMPPSSLAAGAASFGSMSSASLDVQEVRRMAEVQERAFDVERSELSVQVRIGVHIGDVVAGVVGTRRPQYDVWGDACNIAARMESSAKNGTIQVSRAVYNTLEQHNRADLFRLRARRHPLALKGIGTVTVYRVEPTKYMYEVMQAPSSGHISE